MTKYQQIHFSKLYNLPSSPSFDFAQDYGRAGTPEEKEKKNG